MLRSLNQGLSTLSPRGLPDVTLYEATSSLLDMPKAHAVLAGGAGGLIRWFRLKETFREGMVSVLSGFVCAYYLTETVLPFLDPLVRGAVVDATARAGLAGFLIGTSGLTVSGFFVDVFKDWLGKRVTSPPAPAVLSAPQQTADFTGKQTQ